MTITDLEIWMGLLLDRGVLRAWVDSGLGVLWLPSTASPSGQRPWGELGPGGSPEEDAERATDST